MRDLEINLSLDWEKFTKELNGASIVINGRDYAYTNLYDDEVLLIETCNFRFFVRKEDFSLGQKAVEDCGYPFPMGLAMFKPEYDLWKPGEHSGTFRGIQLSMVAAKAGLEFMLDNNIEAETRRKGEIVREYLEKNIDGDPNVVATRGIGLLWGVEVKDDATAGAITARAFKKGLVIERAGRDNAVIKIMPPLIISDEDLIAGLDILKEAIDGE